MGTKSFVSEITPANATNKKATYSISPTTSGLSVDQSGKTNWSTAVLAGDYTVKVQTTDGNFTDTAKLTLTN